MAKVNLNKLPVFCGNQLAIFELCPLSTQTRPEVLLPKIFMCKEHRW